MHPLSQPVPILLLTVATLVLNDRTKIYVPIQFKHPQKKKVRFTISIYVAFMRFISISFYFLSTQDDLSLKFEYLCFFFVSAAWGEKESTKTQEKCEESEGQRVKNERNLASLISQISHFTV